MLNVFVNHCGYVNLEICVLRRCDCLAGRFQIFMAFTSICNNGPMRLPYVTYCQSAGEENRVLAVEESVGIL